LWSEAPEVLAHLGASLFQVKISGESAPVFICYSMLSGEAMIAVKDRENICNHWRLCYAMLLYGMHRIKLDMVGVGGSNPLAPTNEFNNTGYQGQGGLFYWSVAIMMDLISG